MSSTTTFYIPCRKRRAPKSVEKQRSARSRVQELARFRVEPYNDWGLRHVRLTPLRLEPGIVFPPDAVKPRVTIYIAGIYRISLCCDVLTYACQPSAVRLFVDGVYRGALLLPTAVCAAGYESHCYIRFESGSELEFREHVSSRLEVSCGVFLRRGEISLKLLQASSF